MFKKAVLERVYMGLHRRDTFSISEIISPVPYLWFVPCRDKAIETVTGNMKLFKPQEDTGVMLPKLCLTKNDILLPGLKIQFLIFPSTLPQTPSIYSHFHLELMSLSPKASAAGRYV